MFILILFSYTSIKEKKINENRFLRQGEYLNLRCLC